MRNYWKSHNFKKIETGVINKMMEYAGKIPSDQSEIFLGLISGFANRVPTAATAYSSRDARFVMNVHARWEYPNDDDRCISWARRFFKAAAPYASQGAYINFMTEDEQGIGIAVAYDSNELSTYKNKDNIRSKKYFPNQSKYKTPHACVIKRQ
ncbi:MAG: hypothetical protein U5J63_05055 [Fodinibius sp.]|nr:hypothetical protein [Fodinibius sp.]